MGYDGTVYHRPGSALSVPCALCVWDALDRRERLMLTLLHTPMVRAFQVSDLDAICNRDGAQIPREALLAQASMGPTWTGLVDEVPLACGGITLPWPGIGMAWMVVGPDMLRYRVWFTRTVKRFLADTVARYQLHRVEAQALEESVVNQWWLEALGLTPEKDGRAQAYLA